MIQKHKHFLSEAIFTRTVMELFVRLQGSSKIMQLHCLAPADGE